MGLQVLDWAVAQRYLKVGWREESEINICPLLLPVVRGSALPD